MALFALLFWKVLVYKLDSGDLNKRDLKGQLQRILKLISNKNLFSRFLPRS